MGWNSSPPPLPRRLIDRWKARVEEARNEGKRVDRRGVNRINENGEWRANNALFPLWTWPLFDVSWNNFQL